MVWGDPVTVQCGQSLYRFDKFLELDTFLTVPEPLASKQKTRYQHLSTPPRDGKNTEGNVAGKDIGPNPASTYSQ